MSKKTKVIIIGAGFVGSTIAFSLALKNIANEIIIIDVDKGKSIGETLDIKHGISSFGDQTIRVGDYSDCSNSDLIIIASGRNRRVGETRLNMIQDNIIIMNSIILELKKHYTKGVIMVVSNPVDILTYWVDKKMCLPNGRVFGTGCILDVSRLTREVADYVHESTKDIICNIIGEHGDSQIIVWSNAFVNKTKIEEYCQKHNIVWNDKIKNVFETKIKSRGSEIIERKGKTHFGIAICVCYLAEAILNDKKVIASVSSPLTGEYNIKDVSLSLPSIVGAEGVEKRLVGDLLAEEEKSLVLSSLKIKKVIKDIR